MFSKSLSLKSSEGIMPKPKTGAQRQAAYVASGRQIACVIRDADALIAMSRLEKEQGGVTAAITYALKHTKGSSRHAKS